MAPNANAVSLSRTESFESVCREIHDSLGEEKRLVQVLVGLSQAECRKVRETYMELYGEDLVQKFDPGLQFLLCLMLDPFERDAVFARESLHGNNSVNYKALVEIFTCRKSSHVLLILQAYHAKYRSQLDLDIASIEPPHPYQKQMLMALSASHKAHHADVSQHIAKCDARRLFQTGEGRPGAIDEAVVLEIFSKRSIGQLKLTFFSYKHIYGHSYTSFLKNEDSGEFEDAVRVVVKCICSPPRYYAEALYGCLKGTTNDKAALVRVMVSRTEVDMDEIRCNFKKKYGVELKNVICETTPEGNHRDFLVALATKTSTC
ncbi:annexin A3 isoform X1 [Sesamum indicum]|uniref:Annexin A3 isoform X1 n=1 Tax=Sesamum indicum TaxID=4182 RepID=A0A6I9U1W8_SESIN|nr:annexin A3 isoform X1 [Sesamum indicum]